MYPEEEPVRTEVEEEAKYNVSRLAHHTSLNIWNGCNENIWAYRDWGWKDYANVQKLSWGKGYYFDLLPKICNELTPTIPYWAGSPWSGDFDVDNGIPPNADTHGNIVCATQSQSLHFGAGVVPPGTGVVMNDSMSNFSFTDSKSINYLAPGRRSRSTIAPTIVLHGGKPDFAIGIPGAGRIPTALLQTLLDRLALKRSLAEAIGDTRVHFVSSIRRDQGEAFEAEQSFPHTEAKALQALGWKVNLPEPAGTGRYFGGINAVEFNADGTLTGYADPRRTNVAGGY
jgi:hypothetical protein